MYESLKMLIDSEAERMFGIGFNEEKIDLCCADIRRGAMAALDVAREACRVRPDRQRGRTKKKDKMSAVELLKLLDAWCEERNGYRKQK